MGQGASGLVSVLNCTQLLSLMVCSDYKVRKYVEHVLTLTHVQFHCEEPHCDTVISDTHQTQTTRHNDTITATTGVTAVNSGELLVPRKTKPDD